MPRTKLHIISFDVPYPADYGGAIDVFYKIKSLAEAGCDIYLHCYQYGRENAAELEKYCEQVWYYKRITGRKSVSATIPYIVYSRRDGQLIDNLLSVDAPILFEGIHTTYFINHPKLKNRFKAIRNHNIEFDYYSQLASKEYNLVKKAYYISEAQLLKKYERRLYTANAFFSLSIEDDKYFGDIYPNAMHTFIGPFHPYNDISGKAGSGKYCLYHGNLQHPENIEAAMFLLKKVIPDTSFPFIITGRNPSEKIIKACKKLPNCKLIANPTDTELQQLFDNTHIHVLPTFQSTGMKLKLLYALYNGRHVVVNDKMLYGTGLTDICYTANSANEFITQLYNLMATPFTQQDIDERASVLNIHFNNRRNALRLLTGLTPTSLSAAPVQPS